MEGEQMERAERLGRRVRRARVALTGLGQEDFARKAGVRTNAISRIERGENFPSVTTLEGIADACGMHVGAFFLSDEDFDAVINDGGDTRNMHFQHMLDDLRKHMRGIPGEREKRHAERRSA